MLAAADPARELGRRHGSWRGGRGASFSPQGGSRLCKPDHSLLLQASRRADRAGCIPALLAHSLGGGFHTLHCSLFGEPHLLN